MSTFRRLDKPEQCPAGYSLDLYCDHENDEHAFNEFPHNFYGRNQMLVERDARRFGWRLNADRTATCPKCLARLKREKETPMK